MFFLILLSIKLCTISQARFEVAEATARASKATTTELGELSEPFDEPVYVDTILSAREDEKGEADKVQTLFYKVITPQRERDPLVYGTVSKKTEDMVTLLDYANYSKGTFKPLVASLHVLRGINEAIVSRPKRQ